MSELQIAWLELGIVGGLGTIFVFVGIMMVVVSVDVQGEIRLKPRNFGDFQRYPQSAYVQYASIVCLENHRIICG